MATVTGGEITLLLHRWREGDRSALERLLPLVYADLRRMAARQLHGHAGHTTLQPTALVHDVLLKLLDRPAADFQDSAHLIHAAAQMMRHILISRARAANAEKRGGRWQRDPFTAALELPIPDGTDLVELDRALAELEAIDERLGKVVALRYFVGLDMQQVAETLGVARRTVHRDWATAQAWLRERLAT